MRHRPAVASDQHLLAAQVRAHYAQVPAMVIAPSAGGLFAAAVLWNAVPRRYLVAGVAAVWLLSALRLWLWRCYRQSPRRDGQRRWRVLAVLAAFVSGCLWGAAAPLLYPPASAPHAVFVLVLLTLLPMIPIAALAAYLPALYAYYLPCLTPFLLTLALAGTTPERMAAVLLLAMMAAMLTFAHRYAATLADAVALETQLAAKADALQESMRQKSRFVGAASHDLKQPLHAMGLFVDLLRGARGHGARREELDHLAASLKSLRVMLDDMLQVCKLDEQKVVPRLQHFDVAPLLRRLHAEFALLAGERGLQLRLRAAGAVVVSDPLLLERMLRNLLANALKFTHHGGVALLCRRHGAAVRLQVCDTGPGIRHEDHDAVFEEFTQIDNRSGDDGKGLGLGLAIVARLAALLQHRVTLVSTPGRGSTFTIEVARGSAEHAVPIDAPAATPRALAPGHLVLVVDDDLAVRATTARLFEQWGQRAWAAASAGAALALLDAAEARPQLLVVDLEIGGGESGIELIAAIRRRVDEPALPAILIAGDPAPGHTSAAQRRGIVLLRKPVDPQQLEAAAATALFTAAA